jgi:hypothetical protein
MKHLLALLPLSFLAFAAAYGANAPLSALPPAPPTPPAQSPVCLDSSHVENLYCAVGVVTSVEFITDKQIESIKMGSPIAEVKFDPEHKILDIFPKVQEGRTNMNIVVDGATYVFTLNVVSDGSKIDFRRTFTFARETEDADAATMAKAPCLKPGDIDIVGAVKEVEQARFDPVYRSKLPFYRMKPVNKIYQWNGNLIHLLEAHQFVDKDLIVLKIQWLNEQPRAYYIKDSQYEVWLANKQIPVTARLQSTDGTVFPGQLETVWLFIQGYRLSINNPWELKLPPEASSVRQLLH